MDYVDDHHDLNYYDIYIYMELSLFFTLLYIFYYFNFLLFKQNGLLIKFNKIYREYKLYTIIVYVYIGYMYNIYKSFNLLIKSMCLYLHFVYYSVPRTTFTPPPCVFV